MATLPEPNAAPTSALRRVARVTRRLRRRLMTTAAALLEGPAPLAAAFAALVAAPLGGPATAAVAGLAGAVAGQTCVRRRHLRPHEQVLALQVFGDSLPDLRRIVLTDLSGLGAIPFVCPGWGGRIFLNLGRQGFEDPVALRSACYDRPGKLLVHELAHAWQIVHGHYGPLLFRRILAGPCAGDAFYRPPRMLEAPWPPLNLEQQATIVDEWFAPGRLGPDGWAGTAGLSICHPYWPYIRDVVRAAGNHGGRRP